LIGAQENDVHPLAFEALAIAVGTLPETTGRTADDAVLTLSILNFQTGAALSFPAKRSVLAFCSVDEAAEPDIHHQANCQENEQRGRAPIAHER
jgi:hypothetical protein